MQELLHCICSISEPPLNSRLVCLSGRGRRVELASFLQLYPVLKGRGGRCYLAPMTDEKAMVLRG